MMSQHPPILVFRYNPLPISETFIYNQSIHLKGYNAYFLGLVLPSGKKLLLPEDKVHIINQGGLSGSINEALIKLCGYIPRKTFEWVRSIGPKLIHVYKGSDATMIVPLSKKLGIPLVVSFLGTDATLEDSFTKKIGLSSRLYLLRRKRLAKLVAKVIVPSEFLKQKVIERGFACEKIEVIHPGIDLHMFTPKINQTEFNHILFVGRLEPVKGLDILIRAIGLIKPNFPKVHLTVIGDGLFRKTYEDLAKRILRDNYEFLGFQPSDEIREYLKRAYLFSMPSTTMPSGQAEAFGVVFVEAQAMGVPVVSFATGGIPEAVAYGETGLLSQECTVEALAKNLETLLGDRELRNRMSVQARLRVESLFDLEQQNKKLEALYDRLLNE